MILKGMAGVETNPQSVQWTAEQLDALARASSTPDLDEDREWTEELHERVYVPLIAAGLIAQTMRDHATDPEMEVVHYETTELGIALLKRTAS